MRYIEALQIMQNARVRWPALVCLDGRYFCFSGTRILGSGVNYQEALDASGLLNRKPEWNKDNAPLFVNIDTTVLRGGENVCVARSINMAVRIVRALNAYTPDSTGK